MASPVLFQTEIAGIEVAIREDAARNELIVDVAEKKLRKKVTRALAKALDANMPADSFISYEAPAPAIGVYPNASNPYYDGRFGQAYFARLGDLINELKPTIERELGFESKPTPIDETTFMAAFARASEIDLKKCPPVTLAIAMYNFSITHRVEMPSIPVTPGSPIAHGRQSIIDHALFPQAEEVALQFMTDQRLGTDSTTKYAIASALMNFSLDINNPGRRK